VKQVADRVVLVSSWRRSRQKFTHLARHWHSFKRSDAELTRRYLKGVRTTAPH
jgi:hypothetical protein